MSELSEFERLIFETSDRDDKIAILDIWLSEIRHEVKQLERRLNRASELKNLLWDARESIDKEVYSGIFEGDMPTVNWARLLYLVKDKYVSTKDEQHE